MQIEELSCFMLGMNRRYLASLIILFTSVVSPVFGEEEKEKSELELLFDSMGIDDKISKRLSDLKTDELQEVKK